MQIKPVLMSCMQADTHFPSDGEGRVFDIDKLCEDDILTQTIERCLNGERIVPEHVSWFVPAPLWAPIVQRNGEEVFLCAAATYGERVIEFVCPV